ncbi:MAG: hypothetical protein ABIW33_06660 [Sphingomicrobium sp.]
MIRIRRTMTALLLGATSQLAVAASPVAGNWEGEATSDQWPTFLRIEIEKGVHAPATLFVLGQTVELGKTKDAATLDSTLGDGSDALRLVGHVERGHLVGTMSESRKTFAFSLQRIPAYAPTTNRVIGWSRDLDALRNRLLTFDRSFSPAEKVAARRRIEQLRSDLPRLSDDAVRVRISRIATLANNAHTRLYYLRNRTEVQRMPIRGWWFGDEFRVVRAARDYSQYLGCRIDRVGTLATAAAKARVDGLFAGSPTWRTYMSGYSLTSPEVLRGAGIVSTAGPVSYAFSDCVADTANAAIVPLPLAKSSKALESWWDLAPTYAGAPDNWKQLLGETKAPVPSYLSHPDRNYWFDDKGPDGIFYIQYNRAADAADEDLATFAARAGKALSAAQARAVVVDLRFNTGGNGSLTPKLIDAVKQAPASVPLYVVTGRSTFSAGIVAAAMLREARTVKIVGEPVGDGLDFWAEGGNVILPYSGLYVHFANGAHSLSPKPCPTKDYCDDLNVASLDPDILAPQTWASYKAGRDDAIAAVVQDLQARH